MCEIRIVEIGQQTLPVNCFGVSFIVVSSKDKDTVYDYLTDALDEWHGYTMDGKIFTPKEGHFLDAGSKILAQTAMIEKLEEHLSEATAQASQLEHDYSKAKEVIDSQNERMKKQSCRIHELRKCKACLEEVRAGAK